MCRQVCLHPSPLVAMVSNLSGPRLGADPGEGCRLEDHSRCPLEALTSRAFPLSLMGRMWACRTNGCSAAKKRTTANALFLTMWILRTDEVLSLFPFADLQMPGLLSLASPGHGQEKGYGTDWHTKASSVLSINSVLGSGVCKSRC